MDFSQLLADKTDTIIDRWVTAVRQDHQIERTDILSYGAIKNHIPYVLKAMVTVLSGSQNNDLKSIVSASWHHGVIRATQGFNPVEIAREYHHLRTVIFDTIQADLLQGSPTDIIRAMRLINVVIDEAIARCFHSYVDERLRELEHLHNTLALHNQELTRLINANQENLSLLAHDLKQPLASIIGYSDLFLRQHRQTKVKDNYTNIEHIERVLRNGRHLLHLINDLLELSQYEAGKIKLQLTSVDVCEIIDNVCKMLDPLASEKDLSLVVNCEQYPQKIITDPFQLQQILTNLVSNAIRYTESGGIQITYHVLDNQKWKFVVADTGIGIKSEDQKHIFEPYFRCNNQNYHLPDSTGLGLAIVSRLVKLLQGEIMLFSQPGIGSTFTVILPLHLKIPSS
ncbi:HAMP domain-containing histidine kinase [Anabaena sp. UHCC 0253]|uniref:sensor histidine kinase n=1 Tax=Anabaena sp. UHCC 0253 TaxID=2590019 RepID=UPI0014470000|nr:HAMP domain-containing sensor histidine kinase [Anabaena sp. UHCC 0253]MTJ54401.1 HAMP domain-containing histidine kinase [Anabaena sp. UHCC 0253]